MEELKACPFCGKKVAKILDAHYLGQDVGGYHSYIAVCRLGKGGCGSSSGYFADKERAAFAWNKRV